MAIVKMSKFNLIAFESQKSKLLKNLQKFREVSFIDIDLEENMNTDEEKIVKKVSLSKLGKDTVKLRYKERQLKLVSLILEHEIFNRLFIKVYNSGELPTKEEIQNIMRKNNCVMTDR